MPQVPGIEFAARYEGAPGSAIGGDWYAFVPLRGDRLGIAIGDVAGHGLAAVAEMAHVRFSLRSLSYLHDDPSDVLSQLSELVRVFSPDTMVTALYGTLDPSSGRFEYSLAGHFPPALCGPDGCELVEVRADPPLGLGEQYAAPHARPRAGPDAGRVHRRHPGATVGGDLAELAAPDGDVQLRDRGNPRPCAST